jgi:cytochrome P450
LQPPSARLLDHDLEPGDEVVCAIYVMHRSERLWENAATFDPERFAPERGEGRHRFAFLPFGAGAHACLGMPLALAEMVAILAQITKALSFASDQSRPVYPVMRLTLRPDSGVSLHVDERRGAMIAPAPMQSAADSC